jgi:hypothetical protein
MTQNNNDFTCPISLLSQTEIIGDNGKVFKVTNSNGKVVQIYDAVLLGQWCEKNNFIYPHNKIPLSQLQKSRLANTLTNLEICPLTNKNRAELENISHTVFEVQEGNKKGQIYDADILAEWIVMNNNVYPNSKETISNKDLIILQNSSPKIFKDIFLVGTQIINKSDSFEKIDKDINFFGKSIKDILYNTLVGIKENFLDTKIKNNNKSSLFGLNKFKPTNTKFGSKKSFIDKVKQIYNCKIYVKQIDLSKKYETEDAIEFYILYQIDMTDGNTGFLFITQAISRFNNMSDVKIIFLENKIIPEEINKIFYYKDVAQILDDPNSTFYPELNINSQTGGLKKKYNGKSYVIKTGSRGGKYILVRGKKIYV